MINKESSPGRRRHFLLPIVAVTWVVIVISAYFAVHKPGSPDQFAALAGAPGAIVGALAGLRLEVLARAASSIVGVLATLSVATVFGRPWMGALRGLDPRSQIALQLGAGLAGLSYLMLAFGALGSYNRLTVYGIAAISLPFALPQWARLVRDRRVSLPRRRADRWLAAFVLAMLLFAAAAALAPPTAWDSLVYHLAGPRLYLAAGRLNHDLDLPYLGFPQAGSMLFLWGMLLAGDRVPQLIHLSFGVFTLALLPAVVRRVAPGRSWLAAAFLIGVPTAQLLLGWAYVEWIVGYAGLASTVLLIAGGGPGGDSPSPAGLPRPIGSERIAQLVLAGLFAGLALNTKYTAVWMVAGLALVAFLRRRSIREIAIFAAAVLVFVTPFLLKNWLLTANPLYPFFLPGKFWDGYRALWYSRPGTGLGVGPLIIAPWEATIWGLEGGYFEGHSSYGATIGPILLALIPLAFLRLRGAAPEQNKTRSALWVVSGIAFVGWVAQLAFSQLLVQTRLLFAVLPGLAILAAAGFDGLGSLGRRGRSARFVIGGLLSFTLALTALQAALGFFGASPVGVVTGSGSESEFLTGRLGQYALAMRALDKLPHGSRVRFLWEPRSYYCPSGLTCEPDALLDRWWHERRLGGDAAEIITAWGQQGVTHVLYYQVGAEAIRQAGFDPLDEADWQELDLFLTDDLVITESFDDAYTLYRLP
ncbi:MAG: hypothetical protein ACRDHG_15870 [Anaerolineales bacterium]